MMTFEQFLEARTKTSFRTPTNIEQQVVSLRQQGYKTSQIIQHLAQQGVALNRRTLTRILNRVQAEPGQSIDQPRYVAGPPADFTTIAHGPAHPPEAIAQSIPRRRRGRASAPIDIPSSPEPSRQTMPAPEPRTAPASVVSKLPISRRDALRPPDEEEVPRGARHRGRFVRHLPKPAYHEPTAWFGRREDIPQSDDDWNRLIYGNKIDRLPRIDTPRGKALPVDMKDTKERLRTWRQNQLPLQSEPRDIRRQVLARQPGAVIQNVHDEPEPLQHDPLQAKVARIRSPDFGIGTGGGRRIIRSSEPFS